MIYQRHYAILLLSGMLLLAILACQASTANGGLSSPPAQTVDTDAIVQAAVATVEAQLSETAASNPDDTTPLLNTPLPAVDSDLQNTLIDVYKRVNNSVVHIFVFGAIQNLDIGLGTGSGFVFDSDGHIVTNNHVVADGRDFEVVFADNSRRRATVVGTDIDSDLAVIKVDSLPPGIQPVSLGDSDELQVGQFVIAIGNPFGETGSMSVGIISGLGRTLSSQRVVEGGGRYSLPKVIQTDAAINPGNSGGPLLNLRGEVIGVNSAILTRTGTNSGVGFSIPVNAVKRIAPALIENGEYVYPFMGISMADPLTFAQQQSLGLPANGVYVTRVVPDAPADRAGLIAGDFSSTGELLPGGDYIIAIDGQPIRDSADLISYLVFNAEAGQTIDLTVLRNGQEITIPLTLGARP